MTMRLFVTFAAALFLAQPLLCEAAPDAASLLALHQRYTGWNASDAAMSSWRLSGTRVRDGAADAYVEYRRGIVFRDRLTTAQGIADEVGFTGRYVWHGDENAFWTPIFGAQAQAALAWDAVLSEAVDGFPMNVVQNGSTAVLRAQQQGLPIIDLYEDANTGAFTRVVVAPGAGATASFDDITYRTLPNGRRVISGWTIGGARYDVSGIAVGPVADADLVGAPSPAVWSYSDAPVPLDLATITDNARVIRVTASVNGHSGVFILGTNTPSILLFDPFAQQAGVPTIGTSDFSPYIGNLQFEGYGRAATLALGNSVLQNVVVQKINAPNSKIAGVLGFDFFARAVVNVDLVRQQLQLEDPQTYQPAPKPGEYAFPLDLTDRAPRIAITLPSGAMAHPVLDSNLSSFMVFSQALYNTHRIGGTPVESQTDVNFAGVGATGDPIATADLGFSYVSWNSATSSGRCVNSAQIKIGPFRYQNPPICFGNAAIFGDDGGSIGLDFLRHFNWSVDYPHSRFVLTPNGQ